MSTDVEWLRTLRVVVIRRTPEVSGPRGWGEGAVVYINATKDDENHLLLDIDGETYRFSGEVLEAMYDLYQDIPR